MKIDETTTKRKKETIAGIVAFWQYFDNYFLTLFFCLYNILLSAIFSPLM